MPRLPLGQIEAALENPSAFRRRIEGGEEGSFGETYGGALRHAIFRYHKTTDVGEAYAYLESRLENSARLRSAARKLETLEQLVWYMEEHRSRAWQTFETGLRLHVPMPEGTSADLVCSGEITRIDLVPSGGYAAWIASGSVRASWQSELRFPLIQHALATSTLFVPLGEVSVGVYDLARMQVMLHQYTHRATASARTRFRRLVRSLGY